MDGEVVYRSRGLPTAGDRVGVGLPLAQQMFRPF